MTHGLVLMDQHARFCNSKSNGYSYSMQNRTGCEKFWPVKALPLELGYMAYTVLNGRSPVKLFRVEFSVENFASSRD